MPAFKRHSMMILKACATAVCLSGFAASPSAAFDLTRPATSFEEERQNSAEAHPQILAQFDGIYDDEELSAYVDRVGQRVAAASDMPDKPFQFFVLNTPMVNAFTTGGGYVYVTRGILASINSEAELAALLGHEIGHVTARHTARRETRMRQDRAASIGIGLLTGSLSAAILADGASDLMRQSYSRKQEAESDKLGVISMAKAGYDPSAMPEMLGALKREVALMEAMADDQGGFSMPAWLSDHPETDNRIKDTTRQVRRMKDKPADGEIGRDAHLDALDGTLFGNDPNFGLFQGRTFRHPGIEAQFSLPDGYRMRDLGGALLAESTDGSIVLMTGGEWPQDRELSEFALAAWYGLTEGNLGQLDEMTSTTLNGMEAVVVRKTVRSRLATITLIGTSVRLNNGLVIASTLATEDAPTESQIARYQALMDSFRPMTADDLKTVPNPEVTVVTVGAGDSVDSLAQQMFAPDFKRERFQALNGIGNDIEPGMRVKLVTDAR